MKFISRLKLKARYTAIILISVFVLVSMLGIVVYINRYKTLSDSTSERIHSQLDDAKFLINALLAAKENTNNENNSEPDSSGVVQNVVYKTDGNLGENEIDILQKFCKEKKYFNNGYVFFANYKGKVIAHPKLAANKDISTTQYFKKFINTKSNEIETTISDSSRSKDAKVFFAIHEKSKTYIGILIYKEDYLDKPLRSILYLIVIGISLALLLFFIVMFYLMDSIVKPIKGLVVSVKELSLGKFNNKIAINRTDEIGEIYESINKLALGLSETTNFAKEIEKGNYEYSFDPMSDDDVLGNALIDMRESLKKADDEEQLRQIENEKRNWSTQGLAKFGDILRQNGNDMSELSYQIIENLVEYVGANIGGIFIVNEDEENNGNEILEMTACFAYDRRKFLDRKIVSGEGLVGTCFIEQESMYLETIPSNYLKITSGLGKEEPKALLLVPLKLNEQIFGVLEIASFKIIDQYKIEFVEKIAESIASTISTVKINEKTAKLLEQSQIHTQQLRSQEEEMRQNMEELTATQEALAEKERMQQALIIKLRTENEEVQEALKHKEAELKKHKEEANKAISNELEEEYRLKIKNLEEEYDALSRTYNDLQSESEQQSKICEEELKIAKKLLETKEYDFIELKQKFDKEIELMNRQQDELQGKIGFYEEKLIDIESQISSDSTIDEESLNKMNFEMKSLKESNMLIQEKYEKLQADLKEKTKLHQQDKEQLLQQMADIRATYEAEVNQIQKKWFEFLQKNQQKD